jgi:hypothetical protein
LAALAKGSGEFAASTSGRGEDGTYGWLNEAITGAKESASKESEALKRVSDSEAARIRKSIEASAAQTKLEEGEKSRAASDAMLDRVINWINENPQYKGTADAVPMFGNEFSSPISSAQVYADKYIKENAGNLYRQGSGSQLSAEDSANLAALQRLSGKTGDVGQSFYVDTPTYTAGRVGDAEAQFNQIIQDLQQKFKPIDPSNPGEPLAPGALAIPDPSTMANVPLPTMNKQPAMKAPGMAEIDDSPYGLEIFDPRVIEALNKSRS